MENISIECPSCGTEIPLTETLASPIVKAEREKAQKKLRAKLAQVDEREKTLATRQEKLAQQERDVESQQAGINDLVARKLEEERQAVVARETERARKAFEVEISTAREEIAEKTEKLAAAQEGEMAARKERQELEATKNELELTVARTLDQERAKLREEGAAQASKALEEKLTAADREIAEKDSKLEKAEKAELQARKERRELAEAKRTLELQVNRRLDEERDRIREKVQKDSDEQHRLRLAEKEKIIGDMQKQVDALRRKSEQGSQQLQGDVLELDLAALLASSFPSDSVDPVAKGHHGGDFAQTIITRDARRCGSILWESKNTKHWSDVWLEKARDDQRAARADVVIIASVSLPKGVETFDQVDGVWVTSPRFAIPLAVALRHALTQTATARRAMEGRQEKQDLVYVYLTGPEFRARVSGIVEALVGLSADLEKEKRSMERQWSKREQQLRRLMKGTAGLYGDLQGIVGATLPRIEGLALPSPHVLELEGEPTEPEEPELVRASDNIGDRESN